MKASEFLSEASGIFNRKEGDQFINSSTGQIVEFRNIVGYPSSGKYSNINERNQVIAYIEKEKIKDRIQWVNPSLAQNPSYLAFAVAELVDSKSQQVQYWGRYFKEIAGNMFGTWPNNQVPAGWKLNILSAQKSRSGFSPQEIVGSEQIYPKVLDVSSMLINKLGVTNPLSQGLNQLINGQLPVFVGMGNQMTALRDQFGEVMAPIALAVNLVDSQADQARSELLGNNVQWNQCGVNWPMSKVHNLVDSYMYGPDGKKVGISSKGGVGARASIKNIYDIMMEDRNAELVKQYPRESHYITRIHDNDQFHGPIDLAIDLDILSWNQAHKFVNEVNQLIRNAQQRPSKFLMKFINSKPAMTTELGYNHGYHALSALAQQVADHLNSKTKIKEFIKSVLKNGSMMQVYTLMEVRGQDAIVTGFRAIYPSNFTGVVSVGARGYSATGIKQKFVFGFD